jgi:hypothetical protein
LVDEIVDDKWTARTVSTVSVGTLEGSGVRRKFFGEVFNPGTFFEGGGFNKFS